MKSHATRVELIEVAQGRRPADLFIKGGTVINVYSGEFLPQNVAIYKDRIAYIGNSEAAIGEHTRVIHAEGKYVSPGFIEPHAHPWVVYNPVSLTMKSLSSGTTTLVNDNLFFYLHMGASGFKAMLQDLRELPGNNLWLVRLVSQAEYPSERDEFNAGDVRSLLELEEVVGTAEITRWPLLYKGDPFVIDTIEYAKRLGKISDGHTAGCSYEKLNSIVAAGISACHEAITAQEALDRLRLGMWTTLRNSSLRPDFPEIMKLITENKVSTNRILLTTDGPHPAFIEEQGSVDGLLRIAVELGLTPIQAVQMATINPATFLGLDQEIGGIAPARRADVLILPNLVDFRPELVISAGTIVASKGQTLVSPPVIDWMKYVAKPAFTMERTLLQHPDLYRYPHTSSAEPVPVIYFQSNVITKKKDTELPVNNGYADLSKHPGLVMANLIDREGQWITKGIMERFAVDLDGMASTYNTTTQLLVIGRDAEAMAKAAARVHELGGGIVIVDRGEIIVEIPLPLAGMMTTDPEFHKAVEYQEVLLSELKKRGFPFHDILYTLLFLTCDFLPGLRLIPLGLYDVKAGGVIKPAAAIETERV
ncbi:adenine deaminase C-terminal domain-containing protein [Paenibacillus naphthalenovorans]|uniref:adenine deaminase C-terminal domain-containing protein n=1 Tax=Paenibacillus naphthalenovorans TaxID=162209 RepID=UPI000886C07D|nr:adenine deaminase C-terminal domain-containing protein [Paenibacillus naphthalenovorans]SDJ37285.1 adenine deaminase [Paenibacillus naphthalenovorans]